MTVYLLDEVGGPLRPVGIHGDRAPHRVRMREPRPVVPVYDPEELVDRTIVYTALTSFEGSFIYMREGLLK